MAIWISAEVRPRRGGIAVIVSGAAAWQPEQLVAPGGGAAAPAGTAVAMQPISNAMIQVRSDTAQAVDRSWCLSGSWRIRLPVAAKIAFNTAGAATAIV